MPVLAPSPIFYPVSSTKWLLRVAASNLEKCQNCPVCPLKTERNQSFWYIVSSLLFPSSSLLKLLSFHPLPHSFSSPLLFSPSHPLPYSCLLPISPTLFSSLSSPHSHPLSTSFFPQYLHHPFHIHSIWLIISLHHGRLAMQGTRKAIWDYVF